MSSSDAHGEPIDVEFEPAEHRRPYRRSPEGVGYGTALTLAVLAAGGGAAAGAFAPRVPEVRSVMDQMMPEPGAQPASTSATNTAALEQRIAALESSVNAPLGEIASAEGGGGTAARVFALQSNLQRMQDQLQQIPSSTEIAGLTAEVQRMQQELPRIEASSRTAAEAARAAFAVAAAADASRSSGPFEQSYASLQALLPQDPNVLALAPLSRTGAPTRNELRDDFADIELNIIRAARQSQAGAGFWGRIQAALAQWVTVRRKGEGDTPAGVVERAQHRIAADDLAGAITELSKLSGPARQVAEPWLRDARKRLEIDTRLAAIRTELSRRG
ncbi:MAG: mitofilin family membrane protein [Caulobacterales bacterium]